MAKPTRSTSRRPAPVPLGDLESAPPRLLRRGAPPVRLGRTAADGIASSLYGLISNGVARRPRLARRFHARVAIRFNDGHAPLSIVLKGTSITVEDAPLDDPDLLITGRLVDIVNFSMAPLWGGFPSMRQRRGRAALRALASGRIEIEGPIGIARTLLRLIEL